MPVAIRLRAFGVHILTALGAGIALIALLEAVREHWAAMFAWLGVALLIDGLDGPIARRLNVNGVLPNWSGDTLDLVVDFTTYVFVPAYAITASGLLIPLATPIVGFAIVVSGALYFADRRMKTDDNHFRGFPTLWNGAAFYLFLLKPVPVVGSAILALLVVLTFVPFNVVHPVRTTRLRKLNLALIALWAGLCIFAIAVNFQVSVGVKIALCAIALYILFSDLVLRAFNRKSA
ncbi:MAG TPA: CDP-alcohol phosphatidyltransferase family protein [Afipia sp.]